MSALDDPSLWVKPKDHPLDDPSLWVPSKASPEARMMSHRALNPADEPAPISPETRAMIGDVSVPENLAISGGNVFSEIGRNFHQLSRVAALKLGGAYSGDEAAQVVDDNQAIRQTVAQNAKVYMDLKSRHPLTSGAGEMLANIAATAPIPLGGLGGNTMRQLAGSVLEAGGVGAAQGALMDPNAEGSRMGNIAGGALGSMAGNLGMTAAGKTINAFRGQFKDTAKGQIMAEAQAAGYPMMNSDLSTMPSKYEEGINNLLMAIPAVGTRPLVEKQAQKLTQDLTDFHNYYKLKVGDSPDPLKDALFSKMIEGKANATAAYDEVSKISDAAKAVLIPTNTQRAAQEILGKMKSDFKGNTDLMNPEIVAMVTPYIKGPAMSFDGARALRSDLNRKIENLTKDRLIGSDQVPVLQRLSSAIEADLEHFGNSGDKRLTAAWRNANEVYKKEVVPFKAPLLAKSMKAEDWDIQLPKMLANPKLARQMYNAADDTGKDAMKAAVMDLALTNSIHPGTEFVNPTKFVQQIKKMEDSVGEIFKGEDLKTLEGLRRLAQHAPQVNKMLNTPQTGMGASQLAVATGGPAAAIAGLVGFPLTTKATLGVVAALRLAMGTNAGTRMIQSAAGPQATSKTVANIWHGVQDIAERNQAALQTGAPPEDQ